MTEVLTTLAIAGTAIWLVGSITALVLARNPKYDWEYEAGHKAAIAFVLTPIWPIIATGLLAWLIVQLAKSLRLHL